MITDVEFRRLLEMVRTGGYEGSKERQKYGPLGPLGPGGYEGSTSRCHHGAPPKTTRLFTTRYSNDRSFNLLLDNEVETTK